MPSVDLDDAGLNTRLTPTETLRLYAGDPNLTPGSKDGHILVRDLKDKRETTVATSATPTPDADTTDFYSITALAAAATFGAPTGTPTDGQDLLIRVKDNGTARALTWNAIYRAAGADLPTTTTISTELYIWLVYNAEATKWDCWRVQEVGAAGGGGVSPLTAELDCADNLVTTPILKDFAVEGNVQGAQSGTVAGWSISDIAYINDPFTLTGIDSQPGYGHWIKADGTKAFFAGMNGDKVYRLDLSTAYDISTASDDTNTMSFSSEIPTWVYSMYFKSDGTRLFLAGSEYGTNKVWQYSLSTAWDLSTGSYDSKVYAPSEGSGDTKVWFKSDGTKMYTQRSGHVYQYSLSTAWDVSTASYDSVTLNATGYIGNGVGMFFKDDGTSLFIWDASDDDVHEWTLTAWDLSTASYDGVGYYSGVSWESVVPMNSGRSIVGITSSALERVTIESTSAAEGTVDLEDGNYHQMTVQAEGLNLTFSNPPASGDLGHLLLELTNGAAGTVAWPSSVDWAGGTAPTLTASGTDLIEFWTRDGGTIWHGSALSIDSK